MNIITNITIGQIFRCLLVISTGLTIIIELSDKFKSRPITRILTFIGSRINAEVLSKVDSLDQRMTNMENISSERHAIECRIRILRFGDEIRRGHGHSMESFNQIFEDMDTYKKYCIEHPDFKNEKTPITTERIKEEYKSCMNENDFL